MKNCPYCNALLDDSATFCGTCGSNLATTYQNPAQQPVYQPDNSFASNGNPYTQPQPEYQNTLAPAPYGYSPMAPGNTTVERIKKICSSPLVLVIAILITLTIAFSLFSSIMKYVNTDYAVLNSVDEVLDNANAPRDVRNSAAEFISAYSPAFLTSELSALIAPVITAIGFWLVYTQGRQKTEGMKTSGLTTLKAVAITGLVCSCLLAALTLVGVAALQFVFSSVIGAPHGSNSELLEILSVSFKVSPDVLESILALGNILFIILYFTVALIFSLLIVYHSRIISSINKVKRSLNNNTPSTKVSVFAAVILILSAAGTLLSIGNFQNIFDVFTYITSAGYQICIAVLIFKYRHDMSMC